MGDNFEDLDLMDRNCEVLVNFGSLEGEVEVFYQNCLGFRLDFVNFNGGLRFKRVEQYHIHLAGTFESNLLAKFFHLLEEVVYQTSCSIDFLSD